ncbi:S41 family peptidase [Sphingomonas sp. ASV193]|uniref:S41 family peptidase n=1 Tax=Sphingomonas sp. ASV193 TaxID=3144405 RepID=UPI0032E921C6
MLPVLLAVAAASLSTAAVASAPNAEPSAKAQDAAAFWRGAAERDVEAAYILVRDNHPAAVPELGDTRFTGALATAHALAAARARSVHDYDAYTATLAAFADALGDKHLWSRPTYVLERPSWPGFLTSKRGSHWIVTERADGEDPSLKGAELLSCDGIPAERMAERSLGQFRVDWSVGAQQIQAAPWLLIDEHNPFVTRPRACTFNAAGKSLTLPLSYATIHRVDLADRIKRAGGAGVAGLGIRRVGGGAWIALGTLLDSAAPLVDEVERRADELRAAPFVVVDVRGNGGGSSTYATRIADALLGNAYVDARLGASDDSDSCADVWRASPGNIAQLEDLLAKSGTSRGPEFVRIVTKMIADAKAARRAGKPWIIPAACQPREGGTPVPALPAPAPAPAFKGKFILLTDNRCFSSCLVLTDTYRRLGAIQVGQTTDANTHYTEVREVLLPSGMSYFSTLQAFSPLNPRQYGPFVPRHSYADDIADTADVEKWVVNIARAAG